MRFKIRTKVHLSQTDPMLAYHLRHDIKLVWLYVQRNSNRLQLKNVNGKRALLIRMHGGKSLGK